MTTPTRPTSGIARFVKDPYSGISHAVGALLSIVALVFMLNVSEGGDMRTIAVWVYGTSLILLFSASALAHSLHCAPSIANRLDRLDYAAIFLLIAGTYTPFCLTLLRGPWGWSLLAIEWTLAAMGVVAVILSKSVPRWTLLLYLPMGWLAVAAAEPILRLFPVDAIVLLLMGGLLYTLGAVVFVTGKPKLFPGWFSSHDLWHTMVLLASGCHLAMTVRTAL